MKYTSTYNNILLLLYLLIPIGIGLKIVVSETYLFKYYSFNICLLVYCAYFILFSN